MNERESEKKRERERERERSLISPNSVRACAQHVSRLLLKNAHVLDVQKI